ncbi:unnamed protein product, partial [Heterosigma akashiwo]
GKAGIQSYEYFKGFCHFSNAVGTLPLTDCRITMFMDESAFDDFKDIEDNIPEIDGAGSSRPETASSKNSGMMAGEDTNTYSRHGNRPMSARPQSAASAAKRGKPPTGPPPGQGADPLAGEADPKPNNN